MRGTILKGGLAIFVISLILTGISDAKIDPKAIVSLWLFNEGKGKAAKDSSGHGIDGKLVGDPKWVDGKFGKALEFDGDDYVDCGAPEELAFGKEYFSVALWMKTESKGDIQMLICLSVDPWWTFYARDNHVGWEVETVGGEEIEGSSVQDGKWHHLAVVISDGTANLYKDGEFENSGSAPFDLAAPDVHIATWDTNSQFYIGIIDEVVIFNEALTEDAISSIMTEGLERVLTVEPVSKLTTTWGSIKACY